MDAETYSGGSRSSSSSASSSPPSAMADFALFPAKGSECGADRMVGIELEAAEALADLAHSAIRESSESGGQWGNKGKRARNRVKHESLPVDSGKNTDNSVPWSSDPSKQDLASIDQQQPEKRCRNVTMKSVKAEQDTELPKPSHMCSTSYATFGGSRSRQNLTEAEKEARRLRRVLANRESARQTIRRRQALCEELTRKAANLAWENESLKREKELAMKEFQSLKSTNEHLKAQMARTIKAEAVETPVELESADVKITTTSPNCPLLLYNYPPCTPFMWPSVIQTSNPVQSQHGPQHSIVVSPNIPMPATGKFDSSNEQKNPLNISVPRAPLYILPCPWFFPHPDHGKGLHPQPSFGPKDKQDEISLNSQYSASSPSKTLAHIENHRSSLPMKVKTEASSSTEARPSNNLNEIPVGFPPDGGGQNTGAHPKGTILGAHPKGTILMPATLSSVRPEFTVKQENGVQTDCSPDVKAISSTVSYTVSSLPEKYQEPIIYPNKKLVDAVAAAEARKRRKELTKLKNLHGRQCQMHC